MLKKIALSLFALGMSVLGAFAQTNPGVTTQGNVTPGNCAEFVTKYKIQDAGVACGDPVPPSGPAGGVLSGTYPNPGMAAGAAATNVGVLGGALSGTLPSPSYASIASGRLLANDTAGAASPANAGVTATSFFDRAFCNTIGYMVVRTIGAWVCDNSIPLSVKWMGATGDGVTNDTAAIAAAYATGALNISFPAGTYIMTGNCPSVAINGQRLIGAGRNNTILSSTCTGATIDIVSGTSYVEVQSMRIERTGGAATVGQDGIRCNTLCDYAQIKDVWIENHNIGFRLAGASFNKLTNVVANNNYSHGIAITNADGCAGLQWTLTNVLSQQNNGSGIFMNAVTCSASVGEMVNVSTYANVGNGLQVLGTSGAIALQGPRVFGGFYGQDCASEIYLDSYAATTTRVDGAFIELAGTSACGRNLGTAATNVGAGIELTANNVAVDITNNIIIGNSYSGISSIAPRVQIVGNNFRLNAAAGVGGELAGVNINAGVATIVGNSIKSQPYGVFVANDGHVITGNDLTENTTAPFLAGGATATMIVTQNIPRIGGNINGQIPAELSNTAADTGNVGEVISSTVAVGSAIALTNNTQVNVTFIDLTAGAWDISALAQFTGNVATTVSSQEASISTTTATLDYTGGKGSAITGNNVPFNQIAATSAIGISIPPVRVLLSTPTRYYLVARSIFATNTQSVYGVLTARRAR